MATQNPSEGAQAEAVCALDGCEETFVPKRKNHKYCCTGHAAKAANDKRYVGGKARAAGPSIDEALDASRERDQAQAHRQELKKLTALEERIRRYTGVLEANLQAYEPTELAYTPPKADLPEHELILCTGDWHTGAKVRIHETGGMYEQDVETTREQVFRLWDRVLRLHAIQSSGIKVKKLHIIGLGDLIDNDDMRPAQHRSVEDVMTVQTIQAFDLFTWLIRQALQIFPEVEVDMVGGNHDRTGRNKGNAGLGELDYADTMSWLIGAFTERLFENEPRVKIRNWHTFFGFKEVAGQRVVFEHGSSFKWNANSYAGIPWYSVSMLPKRYAGMLGQPDITIIGHGHRPAILPDGRGWLIANGALPATSNYEQSSFKSVHRPLQWLLSVHEEHGLVGYQPIYLDVPGTVLPGEIWKDVEAYQEAALSREV